MLFVYHVCHAVLSVHCSLVVNCWERADLLALLYRMFSCVFVTYLYGVLGQVWYLIVWIPGLCILPYFLRNTAIIKVCGKHIRSGPEVIKLYPCSTQLLAFNI